MVKNKLPADVDPVEHLDGLKRIFEKHFGGPADYPIGYMAVRFLTVRAHAYSDAWPHIKTMKKIEKMKYHFSEIQRIYGDLPVSLQSQFDEDTIQLFGRAEENQRILDMAQKEQTPDGGMSPTTTNILSNGPETSDFLDVQKKISQTVEKVADFVPRAMTEGNKKLEAWAIVHACSVICDQFSETVTVPKAMNESGPFYRLLVDMFDHHGKSDDPVSAFKGWKESYGLLRQK
ncbi:hypothetical protein [Litoreibacter albidus]|uniref:Uncharacterized protein n=1 Tax=Litoreibacter albidus TaxID=670155 RepID=A0A1H2YU12_9RHOB|nr:hypothetical protein [Litoreibacter albidus]SDX08682.1 hypothetical protein SAMN04488001_2323 [Litoreibacter albidus]